MQVSRVKHIRRQSSFLRQDFLRHHEEGQIGDRCNHAALEMDRHRIGCVATPNELLLAKWTEDLETPSRKERRAAAERLGARLPKFLERTVEFFPDGSGVDRVVFEDGTEPVVESFKWSLSADGKSLKTEDARNRVLVARVLVLTDKTLQIDDLSHANGHFTRAR